LAEPSKAPPEPTAYELAGIPLTPRARHLLALEFGDLKDFDDPRQEWRRLFSELLGTFFLVLVAAGGGLLHAKGQISLPAAVVAPGLMVLAIILFMGAVSGAHLNPAVSLAFAMPATSPGSDCRATSSSS
jgi:aquaporin Z